MATTSRPDVQPGLRRVRIRVKERVRIRPRRRHRRWIAYGLVAAAVVTAGSVALYVPARSARAALLEGRRALQQGKAELLAGDTRGAARAFVLARAQFDRASSEAHNPLLRVAGGLPLLGRTPDALLAMAEAGRSVAQAGETVSDRLSGFPGALASFAPRRGAFPLEPLRRFAPALDRAERLVREALSTVERASGSFVVGVGDARTEALSQLTSLERDLGAGAILAHRLPSFLGATRPMHYFFGAQNPAELRGTGGLIGAYSILTADRGRLTFSSFRPVQDLPTFGTGQIRPPNPEYAADYDPFGGAGFWLNINMTPDFPSAASAIERLYRKGTGQRLDGVVLADPWALQGLLRLTGPVVVPSSVTRVDAKNVVPFTTNGAYSLFTDPTTRKTVLGQVAGTAVTELMGKRLGTGAAARVLLGAVATGHLRVYSQDDAIQRALGRAQVAGSLAAQGGDFLSLVQDNAGGNKLDFYLQRSLSYTIELGADGSGLASTRVRLENRAPRSGQPSYVVGPYPGVSAAGENVSFVNLYSAAGSRLLAAHRDGQPQPVLAQHELGHPFSRAYVRVPSGHATVLTYRTLAPRVWEGGDGGGTYRLTLLSQPTIQRTVARIRVLAPDGTRVVGTNVPMAIDGNTAVWEGTPGTRFVIEVRFQRSLPQRVWRSVVHFFSKPLIRF